MAFLAIAETRKRFEGVLFGLKEQVLQLLGLL